jgi:DNA-binding transcriptional MerR regulator
MFKIGEFSKIAQVSGRQLRFYDQIGLLKPGHTDAHSGYRFYTAAQLPRLNRILALKELGFSLEEIGPMLDRAISQDELRAMLALKRAQVAHVVHEESARLRLIESRIEQIDQHVDTQALDIVIKAVPAQPYLSVRTMLADMDASYALLRCVLTEVPAAIHASRLGSPAVVMHLETFEWEQMDIEMGFLLHSTQPLAVTLSTGQVLTTRELPALARAATAIRVGPIETGHGAYQAVGRYVDAHHLRLDGSSREVILQPPAPGQDAISEIQVPIAE